MTKREKLAGEAALLHEKRDSDPKNHRLWYVGRTDMQSYSSAGIPEHYAYGPEPIRVRFTADDGDEALEKAIQFCRAVADCTCVDLEVIGLF